MIKRCALVTAASAVISFAMVGAAYAAPTILVASQKLPLCSNFPVYINSPGSYQLGSNFVVPCDQYAFIIRADNVVLDLGGYSIIGPKGSGNGVGVSGPPHFSLTVKNGSVINMAGSGIVLGANASVSDVTVRGPGNGPGIEIVDGTIRHVQSIENHGDGIEATGFTPAIIADSNAGANSDDGIFANSATITGNTAFSNTDDGIECSTTCTALNNTLQGNQLDGIFAFGGTVSNNTSDNNVRNGIFGGGQITNNTVLNNTGEGVVAITPSSVTNNNIGHNYGLGLDASDAANAFPTIAGNNNFFLNGEATSGTAAQTAGAIFVSPNVCDGVVRPTPPC